MNTIDFFLKDKDQLSREEYSRSRLLIIVLLTLISISSLLTILSLFGLFNGLINVLLLLVLAANLFLLKIKGNLDVTFLFTTVLCTTFMVYNTIVNGYILSFNNKWFVIAMITIFFMKPKWLTHYIIFLFGLQATYLFISYQGVEMEMPAGSVTEEFIDNIIFFGLSYALLMMLHKYQKRQSDQITETNRLLEIKTKQLVQSNEDLEKFAYSVSHDLKTPLNNVINFTKLLELELKNKEERKAITYTTFVKNESQKLNRLVGDILEFSRLESSDQKEEDIDLNKLVDEIKESISSYIEERNAQVTISNQLPKVLSQTSIMIQLFKNLIENGIKYNESEKPSISIRYDSTKNCISVCDNGIGIKEEYFEKIFKMFNRLHSGSKYDGSGIGLASCKKIMLKIGGDIAITSIENEGSSFHLHFPSTRLS